MQRYEIGSEFPLWDLPDSGSSYSVLDHLAPYHTAYFDSGRSALRFVYGLALRKFPYIW